METRITGPFPSLRHTLAVAYRFVDVFTGAAISEPLRVSVPEHGWVAHRSNRDWTYRFLVRNDGPAPAGVLDLAVDALGGEYRAVEAIQVALPLPPIAHPPPVVREDFLREAPLWPTRLKHLPSGETAVVGRVAAVSTELKGLRVHLFEPPGPRPDMPYASTDEAGEFLFRLPGARGSVNGGVVVSEISLAVEVFAGATVIAVNPDAITVPLGRVSVVEFTAA